MVMMTTPLRNSLSIFTFIFTVINKLCNMSKRLFLKCLILLLAIFTIFVSLSNKESVHLNQRAELLNDMKQNK